MTETEIISQDTLRELAPEELDEVTGGFGWDGNVGNFNFNMFNGFMNTGIIHDSFGHKNFP